MDQKSPRGGTGEQHGKTSRQSHKNKQSAPSRSGSSEQHTKSDNQSHKSK